MKRALCSGVMPEGFRQGERCQKLLFLYDPPCHIEIKCVRCHTVNHIQ